MGRPTLTSNVRHLVLRFAISIVFIVCALSNCTSEPKESSRGGETHFLKACNSNDVCGSALACMCGVCTRACSNSTVCQSLSPAAACVTAAERSTSAACPDSPATAVCDIPCTGNETCRAVSSWLVCDRGFCRSEVVADAGPDATAGCTRDQVTASEVLLLGDSFFATSHKVTADLEELARQAGAIGASEHYRDNSTLTGNALALGSPTIADQYVTGRNEGTVKVVIMNGGGTDALAGTCDSPPTESCPVIADAAAAVPRLLSQMAADGVQHVVYCFYANPVDPALQAKVDVLRPLVQAACENSSVPCHWLDLRPSFAGHYGEYILADGMNPTDAGSMAAAAAIWATMQANCVAQ